MKYLGVLLGFLLILGIVFGASYESLDQCNSLASQGKYIDAGLCYEEFKVWDKCSYYLLKGAREGEKEWNYNKGDWSGRVIALEYYGGAHTTGCLQNWGRYDIVEKVNQYHDWLEYWLTSHANPPFDMDQLLASLESEIWPPVPQENKTQENESSGNFSVVSKPGNESGKPVNQGSNQGNKGNGILVYSIVGLVVILILAGIIWKMTRKEGKEEAREGKEGEEKS